MTSHSTDEKGASLIGYALMVMLIAVVGVTGIRYVGQGTANAFMAAGNGLGGTLEEEEEPELTPEEKWAKALEDYDKAIQNAKDQKAYDLAAAKSDYDQGIANNKSLPKAERKAANAQTKAEYKQAKTNASSSYKSAVNQAKADRAAAKAEYKANK